jgi:hypothetical protein
LYVASNPDVTEKRKRELDCEIWHGIQLQKCCSTFATFVYQIEVGRTFEVRFTNLMLVNNEKFPLYIFIA